MAALALFSALGCQAPLEPSDPVWGKQACEGCRMLVSDPRFTAQLVGSDGERRYFDDLGCLAEHLAAHPNPNASIWVRDARGRWLSARAARFSTGAATPMDYGLVTDPRGELDFAAMQRAALSRKARVAP